MSAPVNNPVMAVERRLVPNARTKHHTTRLATYQNQHKSTQQVLYPIQPSIRAFGLRSSGRPLNLSSFGWPQLTCPRKANSTNRRPHTKNSCPCAPVGVQCFPLHHVRPRLFVDEVVDSHYLVHVLLHRRPPLPPHGIEEHLLRRVHPARRPCTMAHNPVSTHKPHQGIALNRANLETGGRA